MSILISVAGALGILMIYSGTTTGQRRPTKRLSSRLDRLIAESGTGWSSGRTILVCSMLGLVSLFVVAGLTSAIVPAVVAAAAAAWTPIAILKSRKANRMEQFRELWPDAIDFMIAGIRAGVSLPETCSSLAHRGPNGLRVGFAGFASTYRSSGSFETSLQSLKDEMADPIADRVVSALVVAHDVGGNDLVRVLRTLSDFVRADLQTRNEIRSRWAWTVTAARVAAASPWIVLLIMSVRPEAATAYNSASGGLVIAIGAVATFVGYRLMLRAARLPEDRRLTP